MGRISPAGRNGKAHEVQSTAKTKKKERGSETLASTKDMIKKVAHVPIVMHTMQKFPPKSQKRTVDQTQKTFNKVKGIIIETARRKSSVR